MPEKRVRIQDLQVAKERLLDVSRHSTCGADNSRLRIKFFRLGDPPPLRSKVGAAVNMILQCAGLPHENILFIETTAHDNVRFVEIPQSAYELVVDYLQRVRLERLLSEKDESRFR